jgi:16S rRNA (cytosine1402-N4)-methyltransferase
MKHITVLKEEAVAGLALTPHSTVVDATLGAGGHAARILEALGTSGTFIGLDADQTAIDALAHLHDVKATVHLVVQNFSKLEDVLTELQVGAVDAVLADLGWRTDQFEDGNKGFSFGATEPLYMTYGDPSHYDFTAADIVNSWDEENIATIIYGYGEERYSRHIAAKIVEVRKKTRITTALQLAEIIASAVPPGYRNGRINPATKTFQALRIAVNDELGVLETFLAVAWNRLSVNGRLAIITFHSLEDRIVKHTFKEFAGNDQGILLTKKPIVPTREELQRNPRARSAKLRIIQKLS